MGYNRKQKDKERGKRYDVDKVERSLKHKRKAVRKSNRRDSN
jgi:hypothetical protein